MRKLLLVGAMALGGLAAAPNAHAIGCLSGGALGGAAGHVAGHHAVLGAIAGCAVGHHEAVMNKRREQDRQDYSDRGYNGGQHDHEYSGYDR